MLFAVALVLAMTAACSSSSPKGEGEPAGVQASYSKATGKLELVTYDTNRDGKADAWAHMEGTRLVRMDIDRDFDGTPDRWEYYDADGDIERVGFSRAGDGTPDAWAFEDASGNIARIDVSTRRDGSVNRREFYAGGVQDRAEEDTDGDGRPDKWESYRAGALVSVTLDTDGDGQADRRLTYTGDGVKAEKLRERASLNDPTAGR